MAACSAYNRKVVGLNPGSALLIPEVDVVDIQLRALLGLCSLLVHSTKCVGNSVVYTTLTVAGLVRSFRSCNLPVTL